MRILKIIKYRKIYAQMLALKILSVMTNKKGLVKICNYCHHIEFQILKREESYFGHCKVIKCINCGAICATTENWSRDDII